MGQKAGQRVALQVFLRVAQQVALPGGVDFPAFLRAVDPVALPAFLRAVVVLPAVQQVVLLGVGQAGLFPSVRVYWL